MRIKLTVRRVEIVGSFHMGMRFHLTQVGRGLHKEPNLGRPWREEGRFVWFLRAEPAETTRISPPL